MFLVKQNSANVSVAFFMPDATDPWSGKTGLTGISVSYRRSGDASFTTIASPTITEIGNGWYSLSAPDACWQTLGQVIFIFSATGAKTQQLTLQVVGFDPAADLQVVTGYASGQSPADYVLVTPANKVATDASGRVTVGTNADKSGYGLASSEYTSIASAIWSYATRTLTDASNIASAVWSAATRTLTDASNIASAVWSATTRTLSDATNVASAVWSYVIEASWTALKVMRLLASVQLGGRSVSGTTYTHKGLDGTTNRVVGTVDNAGNRSVTTLNGD